MATTVYGSDTGQEAVNYALGSAKDYLENNKSPNPSYPSWYGSQLKAPTQQNYNVNYTAAPNYQATQGLGDWNTISNSYYSPVYQAYQRAQQATNNAMGASGLYGSTGSGMYSRAQADNAQAYMQGLNNATTQAASMYNANRQLNQADNENVARYGLLNAERQQAYDQNKFSWDYAQKEAQREFANQQLSDAFNYQLNKNQYDIEMGRQPFADYLSLASGSTPITSQQLAYASEQNAANTAASAANNAALWTGLGGLAGGLLSARTTGGGSVGGSLASGLGDWVSSWFSGS